MTCSKENPKQKHLWVRNVEMNVQIETTLAFLEDGREDRICMSIDKNVALLLVIHRVLSCKEVS